MRRLVPLLVLFAVSCLAGCGGDDGSPPVRLALSTPSDRALVHTDSIEVSGRVRPAGATVIVLGHEAQVSGGEWHAQVPLREGMNVIDVGASAHGARTAWSALRVSRQSLVKLPDLSGDSRDDAVDRLESLGLRADVKEESGLFDRFLPGGWGVCGTSPDAGAELPKGAHVRLDVSKTC
ncbi:MAG TPA: PASTA domain-containing protein [Thermoleophilaceae bacterium]|jgi:hypothetical protein